jgi:hypothetical protein
MVRHATQRQHRLSHPTTRSLTRKVQGHSHPNRSLYCTKISRDAVECRDEVRAAISDEPQGFSLTHSCARAPQSFFSTTDHGSILNRFSQDMTLIEGQLPTGVLVTVSSA